MAFGFIDDDDDDVDPDAGLDWITVRRALALLVLGLVPPIAGIVMLSALAGSIAKRCGLSATQAAPFLVCPAVGFVGATVFALLIVNRFDSQPRRSILRSIRHSPAAMTWILTRALAGSVVGFLYAIFSHNKFGSPDVVNLFGWPFVLGMAAPNLLKALNRLMHVVIDKRVRAIELQLKDVPEQTAQPPDGPRGTNQQ